MNYNKTITTIAALGLLLLTACTDGYESLPVDRNTGDYLFSRTDSNGTKVRQMLATVYETMQNGHNRVGGDYLDAATDDAISINQSDPDVYKLAIGRFTANNRIGADMNWATYWQGIRKATILINGVDVVPFNIKYTDAKGNARPLNESIKAECRFLRAYFYFELVKRYGGVPLLGDKVYGLNDDIELPRNTFAECIDFIVQELTEIQNDLRCYPIDTPTANGHVVTAEAASALKARVLLYAASPLFNQRPLENGNELVGYATYDRARWKTAADAARSFMDTFGPTEKGKGTVKLAGDFRNVFINYYSLDANPELIFFRQASDGTTIETANGPLGFTGAAQGNGRTNPTQNLVDAFLMKDGHFIGESPTYPYNAQNPYANRDPRLDFTVLHNGSQWLGTQLATWQGGDNNPSSGSAYSRTSYFMRKYMGLFENTTEYTSRRSLWVMMRYAEVLLNFAEAENEYLATPSEEVYDAIIQLRRRAGIEAGADNLYGLTPAMTQAQMRRVIQNERRIELAFEEHRYWDIRRWRLAETLFAQPITGMLIVTSLTSTSYIEQTVETVTWDDKRYLYPIPYTEVIKNKNMVQNPKW
jgi:hypothetical protein